MACWTILKKKVCLGSWSTCGGDPVVALRLRNIANHRLPILGYMAPKKGILDISE